MLPTHDADCHKVYLLSLWREKPNAPWRAALRLAGSEERIGFADLDGLVLFLLRLDERGDHPLVRLDNASQSHAPKQVSLEIDTDISDKTISH